MLCVCSHPQRKHIADDYGKSKDHDTIMFDLFMNVCIIYTVYIYCIYLLFILYIYF